MADEQVGNVHGVTSVTDPNIEMVEALSTADLRAALTAIDAATYSAAQLNKMTHNDLVYALRVNTYPTSIRAEALRTL